MKKEHYYVFWVTNEQNERSVVASPQPDWVKSAEQLYAWLDGLGRVPSSPYTSAMADSPREARLKGRRAITEN